MIPFLHGTLDPGVVPTAFESIATATGTGSSGTITFSGIPGTYVGLQIRYIAKDTDTGTGAQNLSITINGSSTNYAAHRLYGDGASALATGTASTTQMLIASHVPSSGTGLSNIMAVGVLDIHDYASTTRNKTLRLFCGTDANLSATTWRIYLASGLWADTTAITSISLQTGGTAFSTSSTFALYGIRGA